MDNWDVTEKVRNEFGPLFLVSLPKTKQNKHAQGLKVAIDEQMVSGWSIEMWDYQIIVSFEVV